MRRTLRDRRRGGVASTRSFPLERVAFGVGQGAATRDRGLALLVAHDEVYALAGAARLEDDSRAWDHLRAGLAGKTARVQRVAGEEAVDDLPRRERPSGRAVEDDV